MTAVFRRPDLEAALAGLFPPEVAVAAEPVAPHPDSLWPAERPAIAGAVPARQAEFAAGRIAARRALAALGRARAAIPAGPDRAPLWPDGIGGSIAHAAGIAAAAVRAGAPLGLDIEEDAALGADLWPIICGGDELDALPAPDRGRLVRQVFAAKEAAYKAQYPLTRRLLGFDALAVRLAGDGFVARFRAAVGPFAAGQEIRGRIVRAGGLILVGVTL